MTTKRNAKFVPEVVTSIRLSRDQYDRLKLLADREARSLSGQLRKVVADRLDEEDAKAGKTTSSVA